MCYCQVESLDNNRVISVCFTSGIVAGVGMKMPLCTYNHHFLELVNGLLKHSLIVYTSLIVFVEVNLREIGFWVTFVHKH